MMDDEDEEQDPLIDAIKEETLMRCEGYCQLLLIGSTISGIKMNILIRIVESVACCLL